MGGKRALYQKYVDEVQRVEAEKFRLVQGIITALLDVKETKNNLRRLNARMPEGMNAADLNDINAVALIGWLSEDRLSEAGAHLEDALCAYARAITHLEYLGAMFFGSANAYTTHRDEVLAKYSEDAEENRTAET